MFDPLISLFSLATVVILWCHFVLTMKFIYLLDQ